MIFSGLANLNLLKNKNNLYCLFPKTYLMKTITYTLIFSVCFLMSCNDISEKGSESSMTDALTFSETKTYYVAAKNGLRMRENAGLASEKLKIVDYGGKVEIEANNASDPILVSGIKAPMVKVFRGIDEGYMFKGYLSSIPVPKIGTGLEDYANSLRDKNINARYTYNLSPDELEADEILKLPVDNFQEAFLLGQRLDFFNCDFELPNPDNPVEMTAYINGEKTILAQQENAISESTGMTDGSTGTTTGGTTEGNSGTGETGGTEGTGRTEGANNKKKVEENSNLGKEIIGFNIPTTDGETNYFERRVEFVKEEGKYSEIIFNTAYEGGAWTGVLRKEGNFYVFTKSSIAD